MNKNATDTKEFRKKWGLTQKEFAKEFHLSVRTVENWDFRCCCPCYFLELCDRFLDLRGRLYDEKRGQKVDDKST